jgi:hypothetical protein
LLADDRREKPMIDHLSAAILDAATDPALTPYRATESLRAAGAGDWSVYELADRRLWVRMGADWATLADLAESVA